MKRLQTDLRAAERGRPGVCGYAAAPQLLDAPAVRDYQQAAAVHAVGPAQRGNEGGCRA